MFDRSSWPRTLQEAWVRAGQSQPDRGIHFFDRRGKAEVSLTYPEMVRRLQRAAARFQAEGIVRGDRVLVCLGTGVEWFDAWMGTLFAGGVPVAIAPPEGLGSSRATLDKIDFVCEQVGARWVVTTAGVKAGLRDENKRCAAITQTYESWANLPSGDFSPVKSDPKDLAFLQLTSGSTGEPRAVMIQHRAALHNTCASIESLVGLHGEPFGQWASAVVSWLPLHHDMGLVSGIFVPLVAGLNAALYSPRAFLSKPRVWLEAVARFGPCLSAAPNFAYQLAVDRLASERQGLELEGWNAALFGAEMVNPETVRSVCETFGPVGFSECAPRPCYGMAETTVAVSIDRRLLGMRTHAVPIGAGSGEVEAVVSLGDPIPDTEVRVVSPDGSVLNENCGGVIQVRTPSLFAGYFNDPEGTAEVMRDGGWLDTGDIGFIADGEVYVTGRQKEILIVRGQNIMPHEIEWVAEELADAGGALRCGAFSVPGRDAEQAVLVTECRDLDGAGREALESDLRIAVGRRLGLTLSDVVFVRRGRIPKTTSGKVQRRELRASYLAQELERL